MSSSETRARVRARCLSLIAELTAKERCLQGNAASRVRERREIYEEIVEALEWRDRYGAAVIEAMIADLERAS